jgi:hypothetical protein
MVHEWLSLGPMLDMVASLHGLDNAANISCLRHLMMPQSSLLKGVSAVGNRQSS